MSYQIERRPNWEDENEKNKAKSMGDYITDENERECPECGNCDFLHDVDYTGINITETRTCSYCWFVEEV